MAKIQPVICSNQEIYDYIQMSGLAAGSVMPSTATLNSTFISRLAGQTAQWIVNFLGYDWTDSQQILFTFPGNNSTLIEGPSPIKTLQNLYFIDSTNQNLGVQVLSTAIITTQVSPLAQWFLRNDGANWDSWSTYTLQYLQNIDPEVWNIWPQDVKEVQLEMIGIIWFIESAANQNQTTGISNVMKTPMLGIKDIQQYLGTKVQFKELLPRWKDLLRPNRKMSI